MGTRVVMLAIAGSLCGCAADGPHSAQPAGQRDGKTGSSGTALTGAALIEGRDFAEGRRLYDALVWRDAEDAGNVRAARTYWQRAHEQAPADPTAMAFLGATILLAADQERWLPKKAELAQEGLRLLDAAVAIDPEDVEIRFLRGMSSYSLPGVFKRRQTAAADLAIVAQRSAEAVAARRLEPAYAAAGAYHHGLLRVEAGDEAAARAAWRVAVEVAPASRSGRAAAERLAGVTGQ